MIIIRKKKWNSLNHQITPEFCFYNRRKFLSSSLAFISTAGITLNSFSASATSENDLIKAPKNNTYKVQRSITPEEINNKYNNFYEFGSHKQIWKKAQKLQMRPWQVTIDGLVEKKITIDVDELIKSMPLEERVYRHRCVEAWSMVVPWIGFEINHLIKKAKPIGNPKFIQFESFLDPSVASGQKQFWYPWPYTDGLTMAEANHELAFLATGYYGKPIPKQNGSPLRLAVPWKYGFKHVKGISRITFSEIQPVSFWEKIQESEYGFWANVNPDVSHPRWSQEWEKFYGPNGVTRLPTQLYNGYAEFVSELYSNIDDKRLYV